MSYQPADTLKNRTFIGLMIAQFLAGFNDQAIHASAMFYAIHRQVLSEAQAISIMPFLFYVPWALFVTASAYFADRYSKTSTIVVWKVSEIVISLVLTAGFFFGTVWDMDFGVWMVLFCVFLMGTHAAFFSPAKYGAMPEVLQPHVLSKGNGVLESTTFLSNILGTVAGGLMTVYLFEREWLIGVILLVLSIIGAGASLMMVKLPAADPKKVFNLVTPLTNGFKNVFGSRPLTLSVLGIAFFLFMVSYMRSVLYMHGQTRVPPWADDYTSLIVATVMLGIGMGCPLAGYFSGGKIELGLVPIGTIGMILACAVAGILIEHQIALIACLIGIGFFSGFYMVPLYSLLQFRAPKKSKGEIVAVSNFFNVMGTMGALVLFAAVVFLGKKTGITPEVEQREGPQGVVKQIGHDDFRHVTSIEIETVDAKGNKRLVPLNAIKTDVLLTLPNGGIKLGDAVIVTRFATPRGSKHFVVRREGEPIAEPMDRRGNPLKNVVNQEEVAHGTVAAIARDDLNTITGLTVKTPDGTDAEVDAQRITLLKMPGQGVEVGEDVIVSRYHINDVFYDVVRKASQKNPEPAFDNEILPRYLFYGAATMATLILLMLCRMLPDIFVRTRVWWQSISKAQIRAIGLDKLPTKGPVVIVTNCDSPTCALQLLSATDRNTVVLLPGTKSVRSGHILQVAPDKEWTSLQPQAQATLKHGDLLAVSLALPGSDALLGSVDPAVPRLPVWVGMLSEKRVRVVFGDPMTSQTPDDFRAAIESLAKLAEDATVSPAMAAAAH